MRKKTRREMGGVVLYLLGGMERGQGGEEGKTRRSRGSTSWYVLHLLKHVLTSSIMLSERDKIFNYLSHSLRSPPLRTSSLTHPNPAPPVQPPPLLSPNTGSFSSPVPTSLVSPASTL